MKSIQLLEGLTWNHKKGHAHAEAVYVSETGRALRWTLLPGQEIAPSRTPHSPAFVTVLQGTGIFYHENGSEIKLGPNSMVVFEPGELHSVRAEEELVCIAVLHAAPKQR